MYTHVIPSAGGMNGPASAPATIPGTRCTSNDKSEWRCDCRVRFNWIFTNNVRHRKLIMWMFGNMNHLNYLWFNVEKICWYFIMKMVMFLNDFVLEKNSIVIYKKKSDLNVTILVMLSSHIFRDVIEQICVAILENTLSYLR